MEVSSPAGLSHRAIRFCQAQHTPCEWQMCEGILLLQLCPQHPCR